MKEKKLFSPANKNITFLQESDFSSDFNSIPINSGKFGMLFVYKDTCPYCVPLTKVVISLAKEFTGLNLPFYLANQTDDKYLYHVKTVPAFFFVNSDNKITQIYPEKRTVYEILLAFISAITRIIPDIDKPDNINDNNSNSLYNDSPGVVQLSNVDFVKNNDGDIMLTGSNRAPGILKAYANWCIFCKLKTGMIDSLSKESKHISIYVVDLADDKENPLNEIVTGYPTFLIVDGHGILHRISDEETITKLLTDDTRISKEKKHELIYAINSVMN